jgi:hypothetical protein
MVLVIVFIWSAVAVAVAGAIAVGLLQALQFQQLVCKVVSEGLSKK